jgi:hypothetical protein
VVAERALESESDVKIECATSSFWLQYTSLKDDSLTQDTMIPQNLVRTELILLRQQGYDFDQPYDVVNLFERKVADFAGSRYAVAVDSCSHGIFLCLKYLNATGIIDIPRHTYVSVPMQVIHAGCRVRFIDHQWQDHYRLEPWPITDAAMLWRPGMYTEGMFVISFQFKKRISIGRGGMILLDDDKAYQWLQSARHDGRSPGISYNQDAISEIGWHCYMTPEDAARGILLMDMVGHIPAQSNHSCYPDVSMMPVFRDAVQD